MAAAAAGEAIIGGLSSGQHKESLERLHFLYHSNLFKALTILDLHGVKRLSGEHSCRILYLVHEDAEKSEHLCLPLNFCSCKAFFSDVIVRNHHLCCKHQLAARLAEAMGICKDEIVSDEELAVLLLERTSKRRVHYNQERKMQHRQDV